MGERLPKNHYWTTIIGLMSRQVGLQRVAQPVILGGGNGTRGCSGGLFPGSSAFHAAQGQSKQRAGVDSKEETVTEGTRHKGEEPCFKNAQGHPD